MALFGHFIGILYKFETSRKHQKPLKFKFPSKMLSLLPHLLVIN